MAGRIDLVAARCKDHQILAWLKHRRGGESPLCRLVDLVGQIVALQIDRLVATVVDFDPVARVTEPVIEGRGVGGHELREYKIRRQQPAGFEPLAGQSRAGNPVTPAATAGRARLHRIPRQHGCMPVKFSTDRPAFPGGHDPAGDSSPVAKAAPVAGGISHSGCRPARAGCRRKPHGGIIHWGCRVPTHWPDRV